MMQPIAVRALCGNAHESMLDMDDADVRGTTARRVGRGALRRAYGDIAVSVAHVSRSRIN